MKVFEFHFNPKLKQKDAIFDTFCFAPEKKAEQDLGYLYLVGELKNVLPQSRELLNNLAEVIKREYYKLPQRKASNSFKQSLVRANEFLASEISKENTVWLGNINFSAMSLTPNFLINLSKVGSLKILFLRKEEIFNVGERINFATSTIKTFPNIVEAELSKGDKILVLTDKVFDAFYREKILQSLTEAKKSKEIKKIFREKKKVLREIFGACLLVIPEKKGILHKKIYLPKLPSLPAWIFWLRKISPQSPFLQQKLKKSLISLLLLALLLALGWLIFK